MNWHKSSWFASNWTGSQWHSTGAETTPPEPPPVDTPGSGIGFVYGGGGGGYFPLGWQTHGRRTRKDKQRQPAKTPRRKRRKQTAPLVIVSDKQPTWQEVLQRHDEEDALAIAALWE